MPGKKKGKPQATGQFWDGEGNHLWQALDPGWNNEFWAEVKGEAIILSALALEPAYWRLLVISHDTEKAFTKFLVRECKHKGIVPRYIEIRAESPTNPLVNQVNSWFFLHNMEIDINALAQYARSGPEDISAEELNDVMKVLFSVNMHPAETPNIKRWSASKAMRYDLTLHRIRHLIRLARDNQDHDLTRPLAPCVPFEKKLARYIAHDRPLTFNLKPDKVLSFLEQISEISNDEALEIAKERRKIPRGWKKVDHYLGMPSSGAQLDRASGEYLVRESKLSALSIRKKPLTEGELRWETIHRPQPGEGEKDKKDEKGEDDE